MKPTERYRWVCSHQLGLHAHVLLTHLAVSYWDDKPHRLNLSRLSRELPIGSRAIRTALRELVVLELLEAFEGNIYTMTWRPVYNPVDNSRGVGLSGTVGGAEQHNGVGLSAPPELCSSAPESGPPGPTPSRACACAGRENKGRGGAYSTPPLPRTAEEGLKAGPLRSAWEATLRGPECHDEEEAF